MPIDLTYLGLCALYLSLGVGNSLILYRRIFSPIGVFGLVFGTTFLLLAFPVIRYTPLSNTTALALVAVMLLFTAGTVSVAVPLRPEGCKSAPVSSKYVNMSRLRSLLIVTNAVGTLGVALQWYYVMHAFGGAAALFRQIALVYVYRTTGALEMAPLAGYLASIAHAASYLGGCYIGFRGKSKLLPLWSLSIVVLTSLVMMGRASLLWGGLLFLNGILLSRIVAREGSDSGSPTNFKMVLRLTVLAVALFGLMLGIRQIRGGGDNFRSTASSFRDYSNLSYSNDGSFFWNALLSNYVYVTGSLPALTRALEQGTGLPQNWGTNTFGCIFRALGVSVPRYLEFTYIPFPFNVYTALADWYWDFGWAGVLVIPFVAGLISSFLFEKALTKRITMRSLATLAYLLLWLEFSTFISLSYQGFFWISLAWLWLWSGRIERQA
jgi:oligosaccharide repeat unit polymerase